MQASKSPIVSADNLPDRLLICDPDHATHQAWIQPLHQAHHAANIQSHPWSPQASPCDAPPDNITLGQF